LAGRRVVWLLFAAVLLLAGAHGVRGDETSDRICRQLAESPRDRDLLDMLKATIPSASPAEQARLTVIYCLGLRFLGDSAAAASLQGFAVRRYPDCEYLKYLGSKYTTDNCTACRGSGKAGSACATCGGGGKCPTCGGSGGKTISGLNGRRKLFPCGKCRRSGRCGDCAGNGRLTGVCGRCRGSGGADSPEKIKRIYVAMLKKDQAGLKSASTRTRTRTVSRPTPEPTPYTGPPIDNAAAKAEMDEYMRTIKDLARQHNLKMAVRTDMKRVADDRLRYKGRLFKSRGYLHQASFRRVLIAPAASTDLGRALEFIPHSREVGEALMGVSKAMGGSGNVMVTYGVVNEQNLTLFEMEKL